MPQPPQPRTPSANVEGRDTEQAKTPKQKFQDLTKRLLEVSSNELQTEIEKYNETKTKRDFKQGDR
jgi:hypothetical protein